MSGEIHKNHRIRMRNRFMEHGLDNFSDHEILELLLYYAIPRGDVNPLAHRLIEEFGSLASVLEAAPEDIRKVEGAGESVATLLHLMPPLQQRYQLSKIKGNRYDKSEKLGELLVSYYAGKSNEMVTAVLLDNSCRLIRLHTIGEGSACASKVSDRELLKAVLQYNAANVVLAHNHPRGECQPSRADIVSTVHLRDILKKVEVSLIDHFIVAEDKWMSLVSGQYIPRV